MAKPKSTKQKTGRPPAQKSKHKGSAQGKTPTQAVRIIGGKWKGRKLKFASIEDLRPTLGRTRETLFNWLRPYIHNVSCLDLFAGSGILGFEALSQGASQCTFVDTHIGVVHQLQATVETLNCQNHATICRIDARAHLEKLRQQHECYDLILLDAPFNAPDLLAECFSQTVRSQLARKFIYLETTQHSPVLDLPTPGYIPYRSTQAGATYSRLYLADEFCALNSIAAQEAPG